MDSSDLNLSHFFSRIEATVTADTKYREVADLLKDDLKRDLQHSERAKVSTWLNMRRIEVKGEEVAQIRHLEDQKRGLAATSSSVHEGGSSGGRFLVITSYSTDTYYADLGSYCAEQNRRYCERHGYTFKEFTCSKAEMDEDISPRTFGGYHKIYLLRHLLRRLLARSTGELDADGDETEANMKWDSITHLVWLDADAVVVEPEVTLQELLSRGGHRDLLIAEDQSTTCLLNSGVFVLRVGQWAQQLMDAVWHEPKFHTKRHYEQSAIEKVLRQEKETLDAWKPFHSFVSGNRVVKLLPHVAVFPRRDLNTHIADDDEREERGEEGGGDEFRAEERARFVFHPAGRRGKLKLLRGMVDGRELLRQRNSGAR